MRSRALFPLLTFAVSWVSSSQLQAREEPPVIAVSDALSPADERKAFTVPAGFDVQLVASEPQIQKPIQMAFDARGRLWVTTSHHYPFAAPAGKGTDKLFVLSEFDAATGKAGKVEIFADDLNIPIGILPLPDCRSCIVSSVGEIRKYTDTQGTGKADKMEVLFTGFGFRDTHGMYNSYTYMPDGWVYACHGYLNTSKVKGKDGREVEMNSGSTFRFKPDGSSIEVYTRGQVNPFGIAVDPWLNLYTADCHSKPITQLIPGAYYDSFGKPHDGLGYAPHVTHHDHGSTALCGLTWYDAEQFPQEYKGTMFLGNVVTNRINFDRIEWKGATPVGIEQPDFLASKDPWFRPADIKLGPDGALYVSDFYNKIIGHYEVDLKHPQRDKDRGRVWRIVWKGKNAAMPAELVPVVDLTTATPEVLNAKFSTAPTSTKLLIFQELLSRIEADPARYAQIALDLAKPNESSAIRTAFCSWYLRRGGWDAAIPRDTTLKLAEYFKGDVDRIKDLLGKKDDKDLSEIAFSLKASPDRFEYFGITPRTFRDLHPRVRSIVAQALSQRPNATYLNPLIDELLSCPAEDSHLVQASKIALRNCMSQSDDLWQPFIKAKESSPGRVALFAEIASAVPSRSAARYLLSQLAAKQLPQDRLPIYAEHIARFGEGDDLLDGTLWLTSLKYTPAIGDGLIAYLRALQSRGKLQVGIEVDWIFDVVDREVAGFAWAKEPLQPDEVERLLSVVRLLGNLPQLLKPWRPENLHEATANTLEAVLKRPREQVELRIAIGETLLKTNPKRGFPVLRELFKESNLPTPLQERLLIALASSSDKEERLDARDFLKDAPYKLALSVGTVLAGTPQGAEELLNAVKLGKAPARLLQEAAILERLRSAKIPDLDKRISQLTAGLPPLDKRIADVMKQRATSYASARPDKALGATLFAKHCGACHRIADRGGKIAPQLDGIGVRGLERLLEDVLDPNRNVDQAFRARVITTKDDRTITGLMLRVEGEVLIVADSEGKEVRIPTKEIDKNRETMLSPMPANFADAIPEADFQNLMAYLLDQKAKEPAKK